MHDDFWEAHYRLGERLTVLGQIEQAAAEFRATLRFNPNYANVHLNLGVALAKLGHGTETAQQFEETLRLDPHNKEVMAFKPMASGQN
jgi:Flp pilus assembly protein TadD